MTISVRDYDASKRFYERALHPLGFTALLDWPDRRRSYLGVGPRPSSLWLAESDTAGSLDVTLTADDPDAVDRFHACAVAAGGRTAGEPGIRPEYSREYYAARVLDPDGNSVEAVYRGVLTARAIDRPVAA